MQLQQTDTTELTKVQLSQPKPCLITCAPQLTPIHENDANQIKDIRPPLWGSVFNLYYINWLKWLEIWGKDKLVNAHAISS